MAINLLPEDYKARVTVEYRRRMIAGFGAIAALTVAANIILLLPSGLAFTAQESELKRQQETLEKGALFAKVTEIESIIRRLNQQIRQYRALGTSVSRATPAIDAALENRPAGIVIFGLTFGVSSASAPGRSQIEITGKASSREALLAFSRSLEKDPAVESVKSPVSNLLRETNFDFLLTVIFRPL